MGGDEYSRNMHVTVPTGVGGDVLIMQPVRGWESVDAGKIRDTGSF